MTLYQVEVTQEFLEKLKNFVSTALSHKIFNYYRYRNHKMHRAIKKGRNNGLFKMDNEAPME